MRVVFMFCLLAAVAMGQPMLKTLIGFTKLTYDKKESTGSVTVKISRIGVNVINFEALTVTITPMTYREFDAMSNLSLPREIPRNTLPDPAECKHNYL